MSYILTECFLLVSLCLIISCNFFRWGCRWNSKHLTCIDPALKREFGKCTNCSHHLYTRMLMCIWQMHYEMHRNSVRYTRTICLPDTIYVALVLVEVIPTIFYKFSRSDYLPMISSLHFLFPSQNLFFFLLPSNFPSYLFLPECIWRLSYLYIFFFIIFFVFFKFFLIHAFFIIYQSPLLHFFFHQFSFEIIFRLWFVLFTLYLYP